MSDFLSKILDRKRDEVRTAAKRTPERILRREAEKPGGRRAFIERLASPGPLGMNVIAEIKRASPSKGIIRENVDPAEYARNYELGGAAAISVLTDRNFFSGSPDDLSKVKSASSLPTLRKDFVISSYQVYESAAMGADAVLLIVRALLPESLRDLLSLCSGIGMDALVEVHDESEFETAVKAGARLVGINNRDLTTFKTDIATSIGLAGRVARARGDCASAQVGRRSHRPGQVLVAESGIHTRSDIKRLLGAGIWNFLIGEGLMRSEDPVSFLKALHGAEA
ncbi:MAG: indole-3-glycerol phosphate synthase TrpC [Syntrophobacteraceae bacterium]